MVCVSARNVVTGTFAATSAPRWNQRQTTENCTGTAGWPKVSRGAKCDLQSRGGERHADVHWPHWPKVRIYPAHVHMCIPCIPILQSPRFRFLEMWRILHFVSGLTCFYMVYLFLLSIRLSFESASLRQWKLAGCSNHLMMTKLDKSPSKRSWTTPRTGFPLMTSNIMYIWYMYSIYYR